MSETAGQLQSPINEQGSDSTPLLKKENGKEFQEMGRKKLQRLRGVVLAAGLTDLVANALFLALSICLSYPSAYKWAMDHQLYNYRWLESVFELPFLSFFRFIVCVAMFGRHVPHTAHVVFLVFEALCLCYLIIKSSCAGGHYLFGASSMYLFCLFGMMFIVWEFVTILYICRVERGYWLHGPRSLHAPRYYYSHPYYRGVQPYVYGSAPRAPGFAYYPPTSVYGPGIYQGGLTSPLSPPVVMHYSYPLYNGLGPVPMNHASQQPIPVPAAPATSHASQQPIPVPAAPVTSSSSSSPNSSYTSTKSNQDSDTQTAAAATSQAVATSSSVVDPSLNGNLPVPSTKSNQGTDMQTAAATTSRAVATSPSVVDPSLNGNRPVPSYSQALTFPTLLPAPTHMQAVPHPPATPAPSNVIP